MSGERDLRLPCFYLYDTDMIDEKTITEDIGERAVLVGLITPTQNEAKANEYLAELAFLAETAGAKSEKRFLQRVDNPNPRTFVGKGKLEEIRQYIEDNAIDLAIFDDDLTSKQVQNIENELKVKILDRTNLILDIFAKRAQTATARTQVNWRNTNICCRGSRECGHTSNANGAVSVCAVRARHR